MIDFILCKPCYLLTRKKGDLLKSITDEKPTQVDFISPFAFSGNIKKKKNVKKIKKKYFAFK